MKGNGAKPTKAVKKKKKTAKKAVKKKASKKAITPVEVINPEDAKALVKWKPTDEATTWEKIMAGNFEGKNDASYMRKSASEKFVFEDDMILLRMLTAKCLAGEVDTDDDNTKAMLTLGYLRLILDFWKLRLKHYSDDSDIQDVKITINKLETFSKRTEITIR
jgi:hypothetical protein